MIDGRCSDPGPPESSEKHRFLPIAMAMGQYGITINFQGIIAQNDRENKGYTKRHLGVQDGTGFDSQPTAICFLALAIDQSRLSGQGKEKRGDAIGRVLVGGGGMWAVYKNRYHRFYVYIVFIMYFYSVKDGR